MDKSYSFISNSNSYTFQNAQIWGLRCWANQLEIYVDYATMVFWMFPDSSKQRFNQSSLCSKRDSSVLVVINEEITNSPSNVNDITAAAPKGIDNRWT